MFLKHVMSAVSYVKRKGYFKEYEAAKIEAGRAVYKAKIAKDLWLAAPMPPEETESPEFTASKNADLNVVDKNLACVKVAGKMFVLYENLLSKNARSKWTTIVASQIGANPWTDLRGTVQSEPRSPSVQSFEDCVTFHLLRVFPQDTAEQERYYVNVHLKKPGRVLIRHFVGRVEQLNSYLGRLPGVVDSPKAITKTKKIEPFDETDLAQLILKMWPIEWQDQYSLSQGIILQDMRSLLVTLEIIENGKSNKKPKASGSGEKRLENIREES